MYEWLEQEVSAIHTPLFHVVDGPVSASLEQMIGESGVFFPASYVKFVLKFGNAKLYRNERRGWYEVGVFAAPRATNLSNGTHLYHIGFHDEASVYLKSGDKAEAASVYEFEGGQENLVATDFGMWIEASCYKARQKYSEAEWIRIMRGPAPFSLEEQEIVEARRSIQWFVKGIDDAGCHIIEATNTGTRQLAVLKIGVRSKDGRLNGTAFLKIAGLEPGATATLHLSCYRGIRKPEELELFTLPDPKPEDRLLFPEFAEL
jgi:hypothetical protein